MTNSEWTGYGGYEYDDKGQYRPLKPIEQRLVGRTVSEVWFSDDYLTFVTDAGLISYAVDGGCCSCSYFNDFVGLDKLTNGPITEVKTINLDSKEDDYTLTQYYGYALTTEHPTWGPMTTVWSFRNESNGYYGGSLEKAEGRIYDGQVRLTEDRVMS